MPASRSEQPSLHLRLRCRPLVGWTYFGNSGRRMSQARLLLSRYLVAAAAADLAACHSKPSTIPTPIPAPAAAACPAPDLARTKWVFVDDSAGFTLALPPDFQERPSGGPFRHWESATDFQQSMSFGIIRGKLGLSGYRRVYLPARMLDYSECSEVVAGYRISIRGGLPMASSATSAASTGMTSLASGRSVRASMPTSPEEHASGQRRS